MIRVCTQCKKKNRIPAQHLAQQGKCGGCQGIIAPVSAPINVSPADFDAIVNSVSVPVLIDFWAQWCGPCKAAAPELVKVAQNMAGKALVLKVDTDKYQGLAKRFGVTGIPHFVVMKNGQPVMQKSGLVDAKVMQGWLR